MANDLSAVLYIIKAQFQSALRQASTLPRLVRTDLSTLAAQRGDVINVPIAGALKARPVVPGMYPATPDGIAPSKVPVRLDRWFETAFQLTDMEVANALEGTAPAHVGAAAEGLAQQINADLFGLYKRVYGLVGTPGTTPFATDLKDVTDARSLLNKQLAPLDNRRMVVSPDAEGNALKQPAFTAAYYRGDAAGITKGSVGEKLGFLWHMDQAVPTHAAGTGTGYLVNGALAAGATTLPVKTGTGTIVEGDVLTIAGTNQQYVATSALAAGSLTISPALPAAVADGKPQCRCALARTTRCSSERTACRFGKSESMSGG